MTRDVGEVAVGKTPDLTFTKSLAESARLVGQANSTQQDLLASMTAIGEPSSTVTTIVKTIEEIACQTNILALNAPVGAARRDRPEHIAA